MESINTLSRRSPLDVLIAKEIAAHIRSWRAIVLLFLIALTFFTSVYIAIQNLPSISSSGDPAANFIYLKLLTHTSNGMPPFHVFLNFLAPLLGIALGFDAINAEKNQGTLTRIMAQPIYRDNLLIGKFLAPLLIVAVLFVALTLLMLGTGILITGASIEPQEILRLMTFILISILYVGFWLSLSILLSTAFNQASTAAITAFGIWLFFTVFFPIVVQVGMQSLLPDPQTLNPGQLVEYNNLILNILRISPSQLYTDAASTLLMPSVRSLGPITMEQIRGALPSNLRFSDSLLMVWPQISGLVALTCVCFAWCYYLFMHREIRS